MRTTRRESTDNKQSNIVVRRSSKDSQKRTTKTFAFMMVVSAVIVISYFYIKTRTAPISSEALSDKSEVATLLEKDILGNYPSSPRELLKLYSRINKCFYNEKLDDEQINKLADQVALLYDEELISNKTREEYLLDLKVDITEYKSVNRNIMDYSIENSKSVVYWEKDGKEYSSIVVAFTLKKGEDYTKIFEEFLLRKDINNEWKIMGWKLSDKTEIDSVE